MVEDSSLERTKPVAKITYAGRAKRRRESLSLPEANSPSPSESSTMSGNKDAETMPPPPSPPKRGPGRPPKVKPDASRDSVETPPKKPVSKSVNKRTSISSLNDLNGASNSPKPPSTTNTPAKLNPVTPKNKSAAPVSKSASSTSKKGSETPDNDVRDDVSVTESASRVRRTETERLQYFQSQPQCKEVEPHRALCAGCDEWIALNPHQSYSMRPWMLHVKDCKKKNGTTPAKPVSRAMSVKSRGDEDDEGGEEESSSVIQSGKSPRRNESERLAYLHADPQAAEIQPYEILCKTCQKWIKLNNKLKYSLNNWQSHQKRCSGALPSGRVASADRRVQLVNDPLAREVTATSVECVQCGTTVALEGPGEYNLTKWEQHKSTCQIPNPFAPTSPASVPLPESPAPTPNRGPSPSLTKSVNGKHGPTPSVASTDATAVASEAVSRQGTKRRRDDDDDDEEERPKARPRTDPNAPSGALGWLLLPFKTFVNGFKEGLSSKPAPAPSADNSAPEASSSAPTE